MIGKKRDYQNSEKINQSEVLYHLQLSSAERTSIQQRWANILSEKKRNVVVIDYPRYMQAIYDIINKPISSFDLTTRRGMALWRSRLRRYLVDE